MKPIIPYIKGKKNKTSLVDVTQRQTNMWVDVAKDYGTTSTAIQNAINFVQTRGQGVVFLSPLYTFTVTSEISFDVSKVSILGANTQLDCKSLTTGNALRLYSSVVSYTQNHITRKEALKGITLIGGSNTSQSTATGLFVGDISSTSQLSASNLSIKHVNVYGFSNNLKWGNNAWRIKFYNCNFFWGVGLNVPSSVVNIAENCTFTDCMFADSGAHLLIGAGVFNFIGCSMDNVSLKLQGDCTAHVNNCHFENPGAGSDGYRYISIEHAEATCFVTDTEIILNPPVSGNNFNQSLFYVMDTNTTKGLHLKNLKLFQSSKYQPYLTDLNQSLVSGRGRVTFEGGFTTWVNGSGYIVSKALNLVYNGDAESGNTNGWTVTGTGTMATDSTTFKNDTKSFLLSAGVGQTVTATQDFKVRPSQFLLSQVWIKRTLGGTGSSVTMKIDYYTRSGTLISTLGYGNYTTDGDWWNRNSVYGVVPQGADYARVTFITTGASSGTTSQMWIDDLIVNVI